MKEMIYQKDRKVEVLDTGFCYGYLYYILNLGTHPTAYIKIPETHLYHKCKSYNEMPLDVHGGLTYMEDYLHVENGQTIEGKFVGWDYGHICDYTGYRELFGGFGFEDEKKWTTEEIFAEVKEACYQLKEAETKNEFWPRGD